MSTDLKKHTSIAAGEKPTRAALAAAILSINDVVPVANVTEATQLATALVAGGQVLASTPLVVARADARGLHRIEITYDGSVWLPASGVLAFVSKAAADSWAASNGSYLTVGDVCQVGAATYTWSGTAWAAKDSGWMAVGSAGAPAYTGTWSAYAVSGWSGAQIRLVDGMVIVTGTVNNSASYGSQATIFTLAAGWRPTVQVRGAGWDVTTGGNVITQGAGSAGPLSGTVVFPV